MYEFDTDIIEYKKWEYRISIPKSLSELIEINYEIGNTLEEKIKDKIGENLPDCEIENNGNYGFCFIDNNDVNPHISFIIDFQGRDELEGIIANSIIETIYL